MQDHIILSPQNISLEQAEEMAVVVLEVILPVGHTGNGMVDELKEEGW